MREEAQEQQEQPRDRSRYSVIKRPYPVGSARIPVAQPAVAPHNVRPYQPIKPYFKPKKSYLGRKRREE